MLSITDRISATVRRFRGRDSPCEEFLALLPTITETSDTRELRVLACQFQPEHWLTALVFHEPVPNTDKTIIMESNPLGLAARHARVDNGVTLLALLKRIPKQLLIVVDNDEKLVLHHLLLGGQRRLVDAVLESTRRMPLIWRRQFVLRTPSQFNVISIARYLDKQLFETLLEYCEIDSVPPVEFSERAMYDQVGDVFFEFASLETAMFVHEHEPTRIAQWLRFKNGKSAYALAKRDAEFGRFVLDSCLCNCEGSEFLLTRSLAFMTVPYFSAAVEPTLFPTVMETLFKLRSFLTPEQELSAVSVVPGYSPLLSPGDALARAEGRILLMVCSFLPLYVGSMPQPPESDEEVHLWNQWWHAYNNKLTCIEYLLDASFPWTEWLLNRRVKYFLLQLLKTCDRNARVRRIVEEIVRLSWVRFTDEETGFDSAVFLRGVAAKVFHLLVTGELPGQGHCRGTLLVPDVARLVLEYWMPSWMLEIDFEAALGPTDCATDT